MENTEIKLSAEHIDTAITQMNEVVEKLTESVKRLSSRNQSLIYNWKGSSGDAFLKAAFSSERLYNNTITLIREKIFHLEEAKRILTEADEKLSGE